MAVEGQGKAVEGRAKAVKRQWKAKVRQHLVMLFRSALTAVWMAPGRTFLRTASYIRKAVSAKPVIRSSSTGLTSPVESQGKAVTRSRKGSETSLPSLPLII